MEFLQQPKLKLNESGAQKTVIYVLVFLIALHMTPTVYINSSFLRQFVGESNVGYIYTFAALISLFLLASIKNILNAIGNYKTFMIAVFADFAALTVLSLSLVVEEIKFAPIFIIAYVIGSISRILIIFSADIFLEHFSINKDTGGIRGIYLTSLSAAYIIGPFIASFLIADINNIGFAYLWGAVLLIPISLVARKYFKHFKDSTYNKNKIWDTTVKLFKNKNLSKVCVGNFILRFFYSWMIIYTPIFLHQIGFDLSEIVKIIAFALTPYVLLELPLGKIADKFIGEKEIMTLGFIIAGFATLSIPFLNSKSFWFWAGILFITRVGASMIEIMNETYLFKKIDDEDVDILSVYRSINPFTYVVSPIIASVFLFFIPIKFLFLLLGIVVLSGVLVSTRIKDTR